MNTSGENATATNNRLKPRTKKILYVLGAALVVNWIFGDAPIYIAMPSSGKIVDASTGMPLAGAVVVAEWILSSQGIGQVSHEIRMETVESVSDKNGIYEIAGWGPLPRAPFQMLDGLDPQIIIFKSGYFPTRLVNSIEGGSDRSRGVIRTSKFDGQSILLKPFDGDWEKYRWAILTTWSPTLGCMETCPHFVRAILYESTRIKEEAPKGSKVFAIVQVRQLSPKMLRMIADIDSHEHD